MYMSPGPCLTEPRGPSTPVAKPSPVVVRPCSASTGRGAGTQCDRQSASQAESHEAPGLAAQSPCRDDNSAGCSRRGRHDLTA